MAPFSPSADEVERVLQSLNTIVPEIAEKGTVTQSCLWF